MSNTKITYGTPIKIVTKLNDLVSRNGKTFSDITDIKYMLKYSRSDNDTDAVLNKSVKINGEVVLNPAESTFDVNILVADYGEGKIEDGEKYLVCIGVEFNDSTFYIEDYDPNYSRIMEILYDKIRS